MARTLTILFLLIFGAALASPALAEHDFDALFKEARAGNPRAQFKVGVAYHTGHDVDKAPPKAWFWTKVALVNILPEEEIPLAKKTIFDIEKEATPGDLEKGRSYLDKWKNSPKESRSYPGK